MSLIHKRSINQSSWITWIKASSSTCVSNDNKRLTIYYIEIASYERNYLSWDWARFKVILLSKSFSKLKDVYLIIFPKEHLQTHKKLAKDTFRLFLHSESKRTSNCAFKRDPLIVVQGQHHGTANRFFSSEVRTASGKSSILLDYCRGLFLCFIHCGCSSWQLSRPLDCLQESQLAYDSEPVCCIAGVGWYPHGVDLCTTVLVCTNLRRTHLWQLCLSVTRFCNSVAGVCVSVDNDTCCHQ